jgi:hypothetical protein
VITPSSRQPIRSANDTAEFRRNYGANEFMNALYALDHAYTGQGVTVGVVDDGVVNVNGELDGRISSLSKDFGFIESGGARTKRDVLGDEHSDHGTPVANILGAGVNGRGTVGYAPNATLAVLRVSDWNADTKTEILSHSVEAISYAADMRLKVVSSSLVGGSAQWSAAVAKLGATDGLLVNSAGNDGSPNPYNAQWIDATNRNAILFVGALSPALQVYEIEAYSNRAGIMKDRYVVAVGSNVTTLVDGTIGVFSGTSSAAPVVAALAADILSKWPQLTGQQAGNVILSTTKDLGAPGPDDIYGMGLVDFAAALAPISPTLSNGASQTSVQSSVMGVPSAMGAGAIQTALSNVTVLDAFGRDYQGSVAGLVVRPEVRNRGTIDRRVRQMNQHSELSFGGFTSSMGFVSQRFGPADDQVRTQPTAGSFGYVGQGVGVHAAWNAADSLQSDVMGLAPFADGVLAYVPQADTSVGIDRYLPDGKIGVTMSSGRQGISRAQAVTIGWLIHNTDLRFSYIDESGTVMGMATGMGALRLGTGARTAMAEAHRSFAVAEGWTLEGYGSLGITRLKVDALSLVTGSTPILGSRVGFQAIGQAFGGLVSFGIAQPLTIESGAARLTYASAYDLASRSLVYSTSNASLAGERRVQLTAGFAKGGPRSQFRFGVMQDVNQRSTSALTGWSIRY